MIVDGVECTSLFPAASRALITYNGYPFTQLNDGLLHDPVSLHIATCTDAVSLLRVMIENMYGIKIPNELGIREVMELWSSVLSSRSIKRVILRTKLVDKILCSTLTTTTIKQVVIFGAGMDTRVFRMLEIPSDSTIFELDFPTVFKFKENALKRLTVKKICNHACISVDLSKESWSQELCKFEEGGIKRFDPLKPTLSILEGLVMYLTEAETKNLLDSISTLSWMGSVLLLHTVGTDEIKTNDESGCESDLKAQMKFGTDCPEQLIEESGFSENIQSWGYEQIIQMFQVDESFLTGLKPHPRLTIGTKLTNTN